MGEESEAKVLEFFIKQNFIHIASRLKTPFAEVDLIFKHRSVLYMIEVKTLSSLDFGLARVGYRQRQRLLQARLWLEGRENCDVALAFAYVLRDGQILLLNESGDELTWKS